MQSTASYVGNGTDCEDTDPSVFPGAEELPDGLDNDCDGQADEGVNVMSIDAGDCEIVYLGYGPEACADLTVLISSGTEPRDCLELRGR